jgi:hypothetical protein
VTAVPDAPTRAPGPDWFARPIAALVTDLPGRVPVLFFWCTVVVAVTVLLGVFTPLVVFPALALVVLATWRFVPERLPVDRASATGAAWALGLVVVWVLVNVWFAGEVLLVQRDPGFLTLTGLWLSQNPDPDIPLRTAVEVAAQVPGASVVSDAFWRSGDHMYAQGAKTFPGLIALGGWVAGQSGVLVANTAVGAIALLAVYDLARRLLTPTWALVPVGALALSTPFLYFTRTPFTEPTTMVVVFGGLSVLWGAVRRPQMSRFALGGAMVGAGALSRIDGGAVAAGLMLALGLVAAGSRDSSRRRALARGFLLASATAGLMVLLGYLDVRVNSPAYLADHAELFRPLMALLVGCFLAGAGAVVVSRSPRVPAWVVGRARLLGTVVAAGILLAAVALASRPLWLQARGFEGRPGYESFIAAFQAAAGVAVDGARSYDEMTVIWLAWYLGPVTVALAALGAAGMARRAIIDRRPELLLLLATLGVPALIYLVRPSITPDQIWAMRRLLPVAVPAALLCAAWLLHRVLTTRSGRWLRRGAWVAVGLMVLAPLATWGRLVLTPEYDGRSGQVAGLCELTRSARVVAVRQADPPLLPTLRIMCDADVVEVAGPVDEAELARIRAAWGGAPVLVATYASEALPWPTGVGPTFGTAMTRWPHTLYPSLVPVRYTSELWVGAVEPDGSVTPLEVLSNRSDR